MQREEHLYFLVDEVGRSFYVDGGIVKTSNTPRPLQFVPDGWSDIEIDNQRTTKYFFLDRSFTVPIKFVEDGALILKDKFYSIGIEAKVYLVILKQNLRLDRDGAGNIIGYGFGYDPFYKGEIDFLNFNHAGPVVTVNIMEGGISKLIKANENTKYEIDMDVPDGTPIRFDGINLHYSTEYTYANETLETFAAGEFNKKNYLVTFLNVGGETSLLNVVVNSNYLSRHIDYEEFATSLDYFFEAKAAMSPTFVFPYKFALDQNSQGRSGKVDFYIVNQDNVRKHVFVNFNVPDGSYSQDFNINETFTVNLAKGERLFLVMELGVRRQTVGSGEARLRAQIIPLDENVKVSYSSQLASTDAPSLSLLYVYKQLIQKVTGGAFQGASNLLASVPHIRLTCGDAIRRITGAKLKTSLADFFTSVNAIGLDIGMGDMGGTVRLERKIDLIDYSNPIQLGEVKGLKTKVAADYTFNTLKVGFPEQNYDDVNGRQEFNNTFLFTTPHTRVAKELNHVSVYRADCYGIEFLRRNLAGKTTTDSSADNDIFFVHTEKTARLDSSGFFNYYRLDRTINSTVTAGLMEPSSVFNLYFSPKRCLEGLGRSIHSTFYKLDNEKLVFQTTEKNAEVRSGSPLVIEKADVIIGNLLPRLFQPVLLEFEVPAPVDLVEALEASPVRAFAGTYLGIPFMGIPVKVGIRPGDHQAQDYILLPSPDTNLETFKTVIE